MCDNTGYGSWWVQSVNDRKGQPMSKESSPSSPIGVHSDEEAEIAALAYRFYREEGCPEGKAHEHWLRAEQEVGGKAPSADPKVHQPKVRPRLLGPRILRSKSKFPENTLRPSAER